ncbi:MAG: methylated-DNA--[protein]-cysteine S-methyltransferase [Planctomycetota bacterium]|nr:methylated-DNA--[protein]-cysteine S-methyltransferase [Planctomycetota bacterium]MEC9047177.1 methylated-DNA--[protein]-cysteine S-methyltransferase [Planctomycetota bacterium]
MALAHRRLETPLGGMHAFASARGLRALICDGRDPAASGVSGAVACDADAGGAQREVLAACAQQLEAYFRGALRSFDLPLDAIGTEFQRQAWGALRQIPYGETRSYSQQAAAIGRPSAVRAIGAANGRNPLTIIVPCHRVIGARGGLTGFASGLEDKRALLELEREGRRTLTQNESASR